MSNALNSNALMMRALLSPLTVNGGTPTPIPDDLSVKNLYASETIRTNVLSSFTPSANIEVDGGFSATELYCSIFGVTSGDTTHEIIQILNVPGEESIVNFGSEDLTLVFTSGLIGGSAIIDNQFAWGWSQDMFNIATFLGINDNVILSSTRLYDSVILSNLQKVGALSSGSIDPGFGNINIPLQTIQCASMTAAAMYLSSNPSIPCLSGNTLGAGIVNSSLSLLDSAVEIKDTGNLFNYFGNFCIKHKLCADPYQFYMSPTASIISSATSCAMFLNNGLDGAVTLTHADGLVLKSGSIWQFTDLSNDVVANMSALGDLSLNSLNVNSGQSYKVNNVPVLSATTIGSSVLTSSLTSVGALNGGSIAPGFGPIDIDTDSITCGTIACSAFGMTSTSEGLGVPGMTSTQKIAISGAIPGSLVFDATNQCLSVYNGSTWLNGLITPRVVTINNTSSPYTLGLTTDILVCNGASGAISITLPNAVGISGKIYQIIRTDTSLTDLTKVVTLNTVLSQTIGGSTTRRLWTANESWQIVSDGANWQILGHLATTAWATLNTITITGNPTAPVKGTGVTIDRYLWQRNGQNLNFTIQFYRSGGTGQTAGSGSYDFRIPFGLSSDFGQVRGSFTGTVSGSYQVVGIVGNGGNTTQVRLLGIGSNGTSNIVGSTYLNMNASPDVSYDVYVTNMPITVFDP